MNTYRKLLRIWIALASFVGFFTGWAFLAKTEETETVIQTETGTIVVEMPAIPELPSIDGISAENSGNVQTFLNRTHTQERGGEEEVTDVDGTGGTEQAEGGESGL